MSPSGVWGLRPQRPPSAKRAGKNRSGAEGDYCDSADVTSYSQKTSPSRRGKGMKFFENYFFSVSGVRCQMRSLYSLMVRSEEKMPDLATLMISLRVHALVFR